VCKSISKGYRETTKSRAHSAQDFGVADCKPDSRRGVGVRQDQAARQCRHGAIGWTPACDASVQRACIPQAAASLQSGVLQALALAQASTSIAMLVAHVPADGTAPIRDAGS